MDKLVKASKLFIFAFVGLLIVRMSLTDNVELGHVGVRRSNIGGVHEEDLGPGWRLEIVGLVDGWKFTLPMNQTELGECLGLTVVHTNRVLRELRQLGLVDFSRGHVTIQDLEGLKSQADFDPTYLYLGRTPR